LPRVEIVPVEDGVEVSVGGRMSCEGMPIATNCAEERVMKSLKTITASVAVGLLSIVAVPTSGYAQEPTRLSDDQVERLLERIEKSADKFRESIDKALDKSRADDTKLEKDVNRFVQAFEDATDRLESRFDDDKSSSGDVQEVLTRAAAINGMMATHAFNDRAQADWRLLRGDLNELARAYGVTWEWRVVAVSPE
jgi:hypothetical protein